MKDDEYIRRQDALDALGVTKKATKYGGDHSGYDTRMLYEIQDTIESLEPADVVPVRHGRWKYRGVCGIKNNITIRRYKCSECREDIVCDCPYNFCPNCGAKMDEGE